MKHIHFLRNLVQLRFTGQLVRTDATGRKWIFYLSQGHILYATGGEHPVRRWCRNLAIHCPQKAAHRDTWASELDLNSVDLSLGWEYALLNLWVSRQEITPEQAAKIMLSNIIEVLFELSQAEDVTDQVQQSSPISTKLRLIKLEEAAARARVRWQAWQDAKLSAYSPNRAPTIRQAEQLRRQTSAQFYQNLVVLLNGRHTLQDLAVQMRRDTLEVTLSLLPFIQLGWIELAPIPDLPAPVRQKDVQLSKPVIHRKQLIACVDDSFLVRHMMEKLLTSAGYQFMGVDDAVRSIGILLSRKPDLIFLDLMMPNANGHEICEQLRKLSCFRHTPIVILTGSDGYANRLRSNFVGASDFLSKPLDAEAVLSTIHKYLKLQGATSLSLATEP
ncbi:MAG TPA: response regulator [Coleofasciculaceae cyanobacterium]